MKFAKTANKPLMNIRALMQEFPRTTQRCLEAAKGGNKSLKGGTKGFGLLSHFELGAPKALCGSPRIHSGALQSRLTRHAKSAIHSHVNLPVYSKRPGTCATHAATRVKHYVADRFIHLRATRNWKRSARPLTASKHDRSSFIPARHSGE